MRKSPVFINVLRLIILSIFFLVGCSQPTLPESTMNLPTSTGIPPTETQHPLPTLILGEQKAYILEIIKTNGKCEIPCFLGITPGITTWETTKNFIQSTGVNYSDYVKNDGIHHWTGFDTKDLQISMSMDFQELNGMIEFITAGMGDLSVARMAEVDWTPYKLSTILSTLGPPSRILFDVYQPRGPADTTGYDLWLIYDSSGIIIEYEGEGIKIEPTFRVCPNSSTGNGINSFVVFLKSSKIKQWPQDVNDMISSSRNLDQVTNFTNDQFYQTFKQDSTRECITSSDKNW